MCDELKKINKRHGFLLCIGQILRRLVFNIRRQTPVRFLSPACHGSNLYTFLQVPISLPEFGVHKQIYPIWKREVPLSSQSSPLNRVNKQLQIPPPLAFKAFQNPHSTNILAGSPQTFLFFLLARTNDMKFLGWAQIHSGAQPFVFGPYLSERSIPFRFYPLVLGVEG